MAGGGGAGRNLNATPTWAVALVCAIIVVISTLLEKVLHFVGKVSMEKNLWKMQKINHISPHCILLLLLFVLQTFENKRKKALVEALEKIKAGKNSTQT